MMATWTRVGRAALAGAALAACIGIGAPVPASAQQPDPIPVYLLLEESELYGGATVTVQGELVGDYGTRRDGTMWTQLNDDSYAYAPLVDGGARTGGNIGIGVHFAARDAGGLDPPGGYRLRGPIVRVTGEWRHHDPARGGESYLAVEILEVVESGRRLEEGPDWLVLGVGALMTSAAGAVLLRRRRFR